MSMSKVNNPTINLTDEVHRALMHLYDPIHLQLHPLASRLSEQEPLIPTWQAGKVLRQRLLDGIALLNAGRGMDGTCCGRGYQVLQLRYVEALSPETVQDQLGISKSQYYRDHNRALAALASVLADQFVPRRPSTRMITSIRREVNHYERTRYPSILRRRR